MIINIIFVIKAIPPNILPHLYFLSELPQSEFRLPTTSDIFCYVHK